MKKEEQTYFLQNAFFLSLAISSFLIIILFYAYRRRVHERLYYCCFTKNVKKGYKNAYDHKKTVNVNGKQYHSAQ